MRKTKNLILHIALTIGICLSLTIAAAAQTTYIVNTNADDFVDGCTATTITNGCTLREAVTAANGITGADTVTFVPSITSIILTADAIVISDDVTIGSPMATTLITILGDADGARIFTISAGADTTLNKLVLANGNPGTGNGGAISNTNAVLTINDSLIRDNSAFSGNGGGIFTSGGTVNLNRSTVGSATAGSNRASSAGGIYNLNGAVNLTNSTISNNSSGNIGGGYYGFSDVGAATLNSTSSTIAFNVAVNGGGIAVSSTAGTSTATINNTIVSNNNAGTGPDLNANPPLAILPGNIVSTGYNIISNTAGTTITAATGDQFNTNPLLLPLANNGGLTPTHGLQTSPSQASPAIDKGNTSQMVDQRGFTRTGPTADFSTITNAANANGTDIGAFEAQVGATSAEVTVGGRVKNAAGRGIFGARVILIDSSGVTRTASANYLGYYRFKNVNSGETYVMRAIAKRHLFNSQVVAVNEDITDLDLIALP